MLPLDSDRWISLTHAYGSAADIPDLIRAAAADPSPTHSWQSEPWFSLWSALCHQGDVHEAAYATVPHLLHVAGEVEDPFAWDLFGLPAMVEIKRLAGDAANLPDDLAEAYFAAIGTVPDLVARASGWHWDDTFAASAAAVLVASKGHGSMAEAITELNRETVERFLRLVREGDF